MFFLQIIDGDTKETLYYHDKKRDTSALEFLCDSYASLKSAKGTARRLLKEYDDLLIKRDINVINEKGDILWQS